MCLELSKCACTQSVCVCVCARVHVCMYVHAHNHSCLLDGCLCVSVTVSNYHVPKHIICDCHCQSRPAYCDTKTERDPPSPSNSKADKCNCNALSTCLCSNQNKSCGKPHKLRHHISVLTAPAHTQASPSFCIMYCKDDWQSLLVLLHMYYSHYLRCTPTFHIFPSLHVHVGVLRIFVCLTQNSTMKEHSEK